MSKNTLPGKTCLALLIVAAYTTPAMTQEQLQGQAQPPAQSAPAQVAPQEVTRPQNTPAQQGAPMPTQPSAPMQEIPMHPMPMPQGAPAQSMPMPPGSSMQNMPMAGMTMHCIVQNQPTQPGGAISMQCMPMQNMPMQNMPMQDEHEECMEGMKHMMMKHMEMMKKMGQTSQMGQMTQSASTHPVAQAFQNANTRMMADMNVPLTGSADRDFVTSMIPHHQGAIDMARIQLLYGSDPELRELANAIIVAQEKEIALMREWLTKHP